MPRNPNNRDEFVCGPLPTVKLKHPETGVEYTFYVDGRLGELRNVEDHSDVIDCVDDDIWDLLSPRDRNIICYEFEGHYIH